jgi:two-component system osmolarity sensor histidine kinase EnvZ
MSWSQTAFNNTRRTLDRTQVHPFRALKRILPRRLFGRSLIIVVAPILILQAIITSVFFDRHYRIVTAALTRGIANEVGYMVMLENSAQPGPTRDQARRAAATIFGLPAEYLPGERLQQSVSDADNALDRQLLYILATQIPEEASFNSRSYADFVEVRVQLKDGVLRLLVPRERVTAANADMFVLWMIGSSLVLIAVAILFLRNQVKPIEQLARAAEAFGKGRSLPDFKPYGAAEVRRAAHAFIQMRERIDRHVQQRTDMLAGVSHDLRTPLTRMRLQLAMLPKDADHEAMAADVVEMEHMVNEYLDFARGEGGEDAAPAELDALIEEAVQDSVRARRTREGRIAITAKDGVHIAVRRNALKRCLMNLIDNGLKYASRVEVGVRRTPRGAEISIDDDGPGISEERREEAFRPFHRLDEGRNLQKGGVGLGLALARDIARAHGGDVLLEKSPLGGLRAVIRLPG